VKSDIVKEEREVKLWKHGKAEFIDGQHRVEETNRFQKVKFSDFLDQ
jgi:hypothetical protein